MQMEILLIKSSLSSRSDFDHQHLIYVSPCLCHAFIWFVGQLKILGNKEDVNKDQTQQQTCNIQFDDNTSLIVSNFSDTFVLIFRQCSPCSSVGTG